MHILGLQGQPRRMQVWTEARAGEGFFNLGFWNRVSTIGSFLLAVGILLFIINVALTIKRRQPAPFDPWDARTLEWMTTSPPKEHNFDVIPTIGHLDEFFHRKYAEDENGKLVQVATGEEVMAELNAHPDTHIHLPSRSYWPIVTAFGLPVIGMGVIYNHYVSVLGAAIVLFGVFGWALEPSVAPDSDYEPPAPDASGTKELAPLG
jgi:cytochrome c oxidase subunit 1